MRVVIMGCGRTGSLLSQMLDEAGNDVTVVDWDGNAFNRLPEDFSGETLEGNALDSDVLRRAGIERADAFVAATSGDNRNIMAGQIARCAFDVSRVIIRIKDPVRAHIYRNLGMEVDCRTTAGTDIILGMVAGLEKPREAIVPG